MAGRTNEANRPVVVTAEAPPEVPKAATVFTLVDGKPEEIEITWDVLPAADVAYIYLPEENPNGASYPGVPLSNLLTEQFKQYPKWIQKSIRASKMYQPVNRGDDDETGDGGNK